MSSELSSTGRRGGHCRRAGIDCNLPLPAFNLPLIQCSQNGFLISVDQAHIFVPSVVRDARARPPHRPSPRRVPCRSSCASSMSRTSTPTVRLAAPSKSAAFTRLGNSALNTSSRAEYAFARTHPPQKPCRSTVPSSRSADASRRPPPGRVSPRPAGENGRSPPTARTGRFPPRSVPQPVDPYSLQFFAGWRTIQICILW